LRRKNFTMSEVSSIAVASGKGGTGKTTVATSLAWTLARQKRRVELLDCDVEEPNSHLFLKPICGPARPVAVPVPQIDAEQCTLCGTCAEVCQFNAIACLKDRVFVAEELCHGCGACGVFCPVDAISETGREVGVMQSGRCLPKGGTELHLRYGRLHIGEPMAVPLIRAVRRRSDSAEVTLIDAPPGTSCPVIAAVKGADFVLLVTEPTPFGLNDLRLAVETMRTLKLPAAVVINRSTVGDRAVWDYCRKEEIDVLLEIPEDRRIAEAYSRGCIVPEALPEYEKAFAELFRKIEAFAPATAAGSGSEK